MGRRGRRNGNRRRSRAGIDVDRRQLDADRAGSVSRFIAASGVFGAAAGVLGAAAGVLGATAAGTGGGRGVNGTSSATGGGTGCSPPARRRDACPRRLVASGSTGLAAPLLRLPVSSRIRLGRRQRSILHRRRRHHVGRMIDGRGIHGDHHRQPARLGDRPLAHHRRREVAAADRDPAAALLALLHLDGHRRRRFQIRRGIVGQERVVGVGHVRIPAQRMRPTAAPIFVEAPASKRSSATLPGSKTAIVVEPR